jgi:hypothetical protein
MYYNNNNNNKNNDWHWNLYFMHAVTFFRKKKTIAGMDVEICFK